MGRLVERMACLLRRNTLGSGRHRAGQSQVVRRPAVSPYERGTPSRPTVASTVRAWYEPIDGSATTLVRPYLAAYEREEKARSQRPRCDALRLAAYGIDLDIRAIHACPGAAS
nr:hypothetical protein OG999_20785 [Streptomyces sp. NBC_00886]